MNKQLAIQLGEFVDEVAKRFSDKDREGNSNSETFKVEEIIPTSDQTAVVLFRKSSGKLGLGFFYHINKGVSTGWKYFFPTDAHISGMTSIQYYKLEVERKNYLKNFL